MLTVVAPEISGRWRHVPWWVIGVSTVLQVIVGDFVPVDAVVAAALGVCVGCVVLLAFGGPTSRPNAEQVAAALQECGVELSRLKEVATGSSGPAMFIATTPEGATLTVKVLTNRGPRPGPAYQALPIAADARPGGRSGRPNGRVCRRARNAHHGCGREGRRPGA